MGNASFSSRRPRRPGRRSKARLLAALTGACLAGSAVVAGEPKLPPIYDTRADGGQQIAEALSAARRQNKRVLLQFGANWCIWCHRLHQLLESDERIAGVLRAEYELVLIDVDDVEGGRHNAAIDKRYGRPTRHGLPVLVVLDADGRQLTTQNTEPFEVGDRHDPEKVLACLTRWRPPRASAEAALSAALSRARTSSKPVLAYFVAPGREECGRLDELLGRADVADVVRTAFVPLRIDVERMAGGAEVKRRAGGGEADDLPLVVMLDADGNRSAEGVAMAGFPDTADAVDRLLAVLGSTGGMSSTQLERLRSALSGEGRGR